MLCCVGLFAGVAVGQTLGGPWTLIAPAAGFGIGFLGDMKMMKGMHQRHHQAEPPPAARSAPEAGAPAADPPLPSASRPARDAGPA